MKRFWVVLLALGLIAAFGTTVFAVDVKVGGEFYAAGMYLDRTSLQKDVGPSTAFYFQRLRVKTDFSVAPGLTLITRFDALDRQWGATRSPAGTTTAAADSYETRAENENIAIDWAYIDYKSPIGTFDVGIMNDGSTGTIFGNSYVPTARIKYANNFGPVKIALAYTKVKDGSYSVVNTSGVSDADRDKYGILGEYKWKDGKVGLNINYYRYADTRPASNYKKKYFLFTPYAFAKIGPVALQAEFNYLTGKQEYEAPAVNPDVDLQNISGWVDATADFGIAYAGGSIAYVSGNDPGTDKQDGGTINGGRDWNPCLILFNYWDRTYWAGSLTGYNSASANGPMSNAWFVQIRGGVKPVKALDIMASVSYASADKKPTADWLYNDYGYEVDLTATYKITNNLSYMLGAGYLFTGKYYKGEADNDVQNDYMLINKLALTF